MLLAETSIMSAIRDSISDGEISSFHHTAEHHQGLESDDLKYQCQSFEPIYSGDADVGVVRQSIVPKEVVSSYGVLHHKR